MDPFVQSLIMLALPPVMSVLIAFLTVAVRKGFENMPSAQKSMLASIVQTAVNAVEQTSVGKLSPEQKKSLALKFIHDTLDHFHISVPDSVIVPLLEEAVLILNMAKGATSSGKLSEERVPNVKPGERG